MTTFFLHILWFQWILLIFLQDPKLNELRLSKVPLYFRCISNLSPFFCHSPNKIIRAALLKIRDFHCFWNHDFKFGPINSSKDHVSVCFSVKYFFAKSYGWFGAFSECSVWLNMEIIHFQTKRKFSFSEKIPDNLKFFINGSEIEIVTYFQ